MRYRSLAWVLCALVSSQVPALARPAAERERVRPAPAPAPKLVYRIVSPAEGAVLKAGPIPIVVEGVDGALIGRLRVRAAGNSDAAPRPEQPEARATITWQATRVKPGPCEVLVDVYPPQGNLVRLPLKLTLEPAPPPVITAPPGLTPVREKLWWARRAMPARPEEAEKYLREALAESLRTGDTAGRSDTVAYLRQVGATYLSLSRRALKEGNAADGRRYLDRALAIAEENRETYTLFECWADDAMLLAQSGNRAGAARRVAAMDEWMGQVSHSPSRSQFQVLLRFAAALNAVGRAEDAFRCLDRALEMLEEIERVRAAAGVAGTTGTATTSAEWLAVYRDAYSAQDWIAWVRTYLDLLKDRTPPPAARVQSVARVHERVSLALAALEADANELRQRDTSPAGATYLRLVQSAVADAGALKAEVEALGTLQGTGASNK